VLIAKFIPERTEEQIDEDKGLYVLDIGCGKGGDLGKWQKQSLVQAYVGVDVADVSVMHAEQRAAELRGRRFSTRFLAMDCFVVSFFCWLT
jgi:mRNA (guanine-N7-)-methyltransferase